MTRPRPAGLRGGVAFALALLFLLPSGVLTRAASASSEPCTNCTVATIPITGGPLATSITYDPASGDLYVSGGKGLQVVEGATDLAGPTLLSGDILSGAAYDARTGLLATPSGDNVTFLNGTTGEVVATVPTPPVPFAGENSIAYDAVHGDMDLVGFNGALVAVNGSAYSVAFSRQLGAREYIDTDSDGGTIYAATLGNFTSFELSAINGSNGTVEANLSLAALPLAMTYDPADEDIYIATDSSAAGSPNHLATIDTADNDLAELIAVPGAAEGVAYDTADGDLYVTNTAGTNVTVVNATSGLVTGSITTGSAPNEIAYDDANRCLYVLTTSLPIQDNDLNEVSVIAPPGGDCPPGPSNSSTALYVSVVLMVVLVAAAVYVTTFGKKREGADPKPEPAKPVDAAGEPKASAPPAEPKG